MSQQKKLVVALDVGGTKIAGVLFDEKYKKIKSQKVFFPKAAADREVKISQAKVLKIFTDLINELKGRENIIGIGVSMPDIITADGRIYGRCKIKALSNFKLADFLQKKYRVRVRVAHDAGCFAWAESKMGATKKYKDTVGVIWGTGIGAGVIDSGHRVEEGRLSAGEFGHNPVDPAGPKCVCGLYGCVEALASGPNLIKNYVKLGGKIKDPDPKKIFFAKDKISRKAFSQALDALARGIAQIYNIINPEVIVLGGGLSNLPVYPLLNKLVKKYTLPALRGRVKILKNKLGDTAGVYGSAMLILEKEDKNKK